MRKITLFAHYILILLLLSTGSAAQASPVAQELSYFEMAQNLLNEMTPEERVGQLFLVAFDGVDAGPRSEIQELISKYHVGGVVLKRDNDNFLALDQTVPFTQDLIRQLQNHAITASQQDQTDESGETFRFKFVPLFVGVSQEGNGYPNDQIISSDITQLPSQMTIGATWQPDLARQVGFVLGSELTSLGFNMLLGPSLDVLENTYGEGAGDMGLRTFGGDPYWVGEMGRSFIKGINQGSDGEIAVVAKHFPGYGASDRLPEEEVATIRKTIDQLKQVELAPFFAVTGNAPSEETTVDALLTSHIRIQGLQGGFRTFTKPFSFDPLANSELMNLAPLSSWRNNGGVLISDDLGSPAIKKYYEFTGQSYIGRFVAHEAFLAGNDILNLGDLSSPDANDTHTVIIRTIEFFNQKYREDPIFQERVDESVLRILTLKYRLYKGSFRSRDVLPPTSVPAHVGRSNNLTRDLVRQAATLIWPSQAELSTTIPNPPGRNDQIVFITDVRYARQCTRCPLKADINVKSLEDTIVRLYSPGAGGQVLPNNLSSYTMEDLQEMLDSGPGIVQIENDIKAARWIIFLTIDESQIVPSSTSLRRFLNQRIDLLQQKQIVVFSMGAPFYLDSTDISKLSAYYALYSKIPQVTDIAARLLFHDIRPNGAVPVSVPSLGYDLNLIVQPNPAQTITLNIEQSGENGENEIGTPSPGVLTEYRSGDLVTIFTDPIVDQNGNKVPDNTEVRFYVMRGEGIGAQSAPIVAQTQHGIARVVIRLEGTGVIQVRAESERARNSTVLSFDLPPAVSENGQPVIPTDTPTPTLTPTETPTLTPTHTTTPTPNPTPEPVVEIRDIHFGDWFMSFMVTLVIGISTYWAALAAGQIRWGIRSAFLALIGGLLGYCYLALNLPGSMELVQERGAFGVLSITVIGAILGGMAAWGWRGVLYLKKD
jgi:beta-N-acetylhexosaminidase